MNIYKTDKVSPHKRWQDEIAMHCGIHRDKELMNTLKQESYSNALTSFLEWLSLQKGRDTVEMYGLLNHFSIWYPLATSTQFIIDLDTQYSKIEGYMDKLIPEIENKTASSHFRYPFEDIVITPQFGGKYLQAFISVYKMVERYKNRNGEFEDIYTIKFCGVSETDGSVKCPVYFEFQYINSLFPRINIKCENFPNCPNRVTRRLKGYLEDGRLYDYPDDTCFKSWKTCQYCPERQGAKFLIIPQNIPYAKQCYYIFGIVCFVLDKFNNRRTIDITPKHRGKGALTGAGSTSQEQGSTRNRVLTITSTRVKSTSTATGEQHGTHKSPVEHVRREHLRRLPSGKVVKVKQAVVNKGSLHKPSYLISD